MLADTAGARRDSSELAAQSKVQIHSILIAVSLNSIGG